MEKTTKQEFNLLKKRVEPFIQSITDEKLKETFSRCFFNTLDTTVHFFDDGTTYVVTGDIDAMWLRDSSAQVTQYLEFVEGDQKLQNLIKGLVKRQFAFIKVDPYANSFGRVYEGNFPADECEKHPYVWERKFELDSLCYPLRLCFNYFKKTGDASIFDEEFKEVLDIILGVFETEQFHKDRSTYYHYRPDEDPSFSVPNRGRGGAVKVCGLVWCGYRPSDDPCVYGYLVPSNMFISTVMKELLSISEVAGLNQSTCARMTKLYNDIDCAIAEHAVVEHPKYGKIYAYEVDGLGGINLMDDANVPSLLSMPYMGYCDEQDQIYQNTRAFILGDDNPYYYSGKDISGVGSPHTPENYVWPISLMIQGLTSEKEEEINNVLQTLLSSDADTCLMHESVHKDDQSVYTRSWFAWANSLFALFVLKKADKIKSISNLE